MVPAIMIHPDDFTIITPEPITAAPIVDLDIDALRVMDVFNRPQKAQKIGQVEPESLVLRGPNVPAMINLPIKAPGTPIIVPEWFTSCGVTQMVTDHRFATSRHAEHEMWILFYERRVVRGGQPARLAPVGPHIDDNMLSYLEDAPPARISTLYIASSAIPTICYDGLGNFNRQAYREAAVKIERARAHLDSDEEEDMRDQYFKKLLTPPEGRSFESGSVVIATGATPHEVGFAPCTQARLLRGFTQIRMGQNIFSDTEIQELNPPLWKAMQKSRRELSP